MSERLFQTKLTVSPELARLLEETKDHELTAEEVQAQRESFARSLFPDEEKRDEQ